MRRSDENNMYSRFTNAVKSQAAAKLHRFRLHFVSEAIANQGTRDGHCEVIYVGNVGVGFGYHFVEAMVGADFVKLENGAIPEKYSPIQMDGWGISIGLEELIRYKTGKDPESLLPNPGPKSKIGAIEKAYESRLSTLEADIEGVVERCVDAVARYGQELFEGDESCFEPIQAEYTARMKAEYGWIPNR